MVHDARARSTCSDARDSARGVARRGGDSIGDAVRTIRTLVDDAPARPFVKWVGGKRQLLADLLPILGEVGGDATYHEPFVGGGAVFFALREERSAARAWLSDVNRELIASYIAIRDDVDHAIELLRQHATAHSEEYFYRVRSLDAAEGVETAARLIYLNKTCFNGLYRVNRAGRFNVPWGRYARPTICDEPNLRAVSAELATATISVDTFERVLDRARTGDLVYFDPPYVPASRTASFTDYSAGGFGLHEHARLASVVRELTARSVRVVVSNSDTDEVRRLYAGFRIESVLARREINTRADRRGPVPEVIVRNF